MRSLMWPRSVHDDCLFSEVDWWGWPKDCRSGRKLGRDRDCVWDPPPTGWLKFNVVGVVVEEVAGCGRVLGTKREWSWLFFLVNVVCVVEQVVVMAIKVEMEIFIDLIRKVVLLFFAALSIGHELRVFITPFYL
ncbi:hypothetical protein PVK06_041631 [Gossypium arboreum]|uniref:Transmembrane protein n=1 Tax=Gossypium arboreum TaxID=29729 RepID=A0ABR0N918_GOSAR|nr:hypothetical protein PVK06_041631 [Gossypium arboreum]